jgi:hypothetical protein
MVVAVGRWSLFGGGRLLRFDCIQWPLIHKSTYQQRPQIWGPEISNLILVAAKRPPPTHTSRPTRVQAPRLYNAAQLSNTNTSK